MSKLTDARIAALQSQADFWRRAGEMLDMVKPVLMIKQAQILQGGHMGGGDADGIAMVASEVMKALSKSRADGAVPRGSGGSI